MKIVISLVVVFMISFLLLFIWIYRGEREELEEKKANLFHVIGTAFILALAPTAAIALIIFVLLGSTNAVNMLFSLHISTNELIILAFSLLVYLFSIDSIIEIIVKHVVGKNIFYFIILLLIRILAFYVIGLAIGLNQSNSFTIASGVAFIIFLFEVLHHMREKDKEKGVHD